MSPSPSLMKSFSTSGPKTLPSTSRSEREIAACISDRMGGVYATAGPSIYEGPGPSSPRRGVGGMGGPGPRCRLRRQVDLDVPPARRVGGRSGVGGTREGQRLHAPHALPADQTTLGERVRMVPTGGHPIG